MKAEDRRELLLGTVEDLERRRAEWEADVDTPWFSQDMETAVENLLAAWREGDLPADLRGLARIVDDLAVEYEDFRAKAQTSGNENLRPGSDFWGLCQALVAGLIEATAPPPPPLEPIKRLIETTVPIPQICKIYGFLDARGNPQQHKVHEELETPGKHTGPGTGWVDPRLREKAQRILRQEQILEEIRERARSRAVAEATPPPESLEEFISQGLTAGQICLNLRISREQLAELCRQRGLPNPREHYDSTNAARAPGEPGIAAEAARALDAAVANPTHGRKAKPAAPPPKKMGRPPKAKASQGNGNMDQQIVELHLQGLEPAEILSELAAAGTEIKAGRVAAVLARYEQAPESFEAAGA